MSSPARRRATWADLLATPDDGRIYEARDGAWVRLGAWSDGDSARIPSFDTVALDVGGLFTPLG